MAIYATSIVYDPRVEASQLFFKTIQNKMHWAAHGHTAAEVIVARADAAKPNMGLASWAGDSPRKADAAVAKNYLGAEDPDRGDSLGSLSVLDLNQRSMELIRSPGQLVKDYALSDSTAQAS